MKNWLNRLLAEKTDNLLIQLFRYAFVGGAAFLVDYGLLFVLTKYAGFYYLVSASCSFLAGLLVNYFISTVWVFKASSYSKGTEFLLFALVGIVGLGLNDLFIWLFTACFQRYFMLPQLTSVMLSKLVSTVLVYLWNFLGRRFLIFNRKSQTT
ncbi:MAG: GtrA family protein [Tannerella sp.]|jgi:putative flippase GtrA|nr:GtrA family protein [Tannerella sp.]